MEMDLREIHPDHIDSWVFNWVGTIDGVKHGCSLNGLTHRFFWRAIVRLYTWRLRLLVSEQRS